MAIIAAVDSDGAVVASGIVAWVMMAGEYIIRQIYYSSFLTNVYVALQTKPLNYPAVGCITDLYTMVAQAALQLPNPFKNKTFKLRYVCTLDSLIDSFQHCYDQQCASTQCNS